MRRAVLAALILVGIAGVVGGASGGSVADLAADVDSRAASASDAVAIANRPWPTRVIGLGLGASVGAAIGGSAAFLHYRTGKS